MSAWRRHQRELDFDIGETQAHEYLKMGKSLASSSGAAVRHTSLRAFQRAHPPKPRIPSDLQKELQSVDFVSLRQAVLERPEEHKLRVELANRLIDVGIRTLAAKLPPDKAGTVAAMA